MSKSGRRSRVARSSGSAFFFFSFISSWSRHPIPFHEVFPLVETEWMCNLVKSLFLETVIRSDESDTDPNLFLARIGAFLILLEKNPPLYFWEQRKTILYNLRKILRIGGVENLSFFFFNQPFFLFLLHPNKNQLTFIGQQG